MRYMRCVLGRLGLVRGPTSQSPASPPSARAHPAGLMQEAGAAAKAMSKDDNELVVRQLLLDGCLQVGLGLMQEGLAERVCSCAVAWVPGLLVRSGRQAAHAASKQRAARSLGSPAPHGKHTQQSLHRFPRSWTLDSLRTLPTAT